MFSKGIVLIFLILGLSSSIAHAIPYQNRAADDNPCEDSSAVSQTHTTNKSADKSTTKQDDTGNTAALKKGAGTTLTSNNNTDANPQGNGNDGANSDGNGKTNTSVNDNSKKAANTKGSAATTAKGANPQDNGNNNNTTGNTGSNDPNNSHCLVEAVISNGSESNGLNNATAGTSASLTSTNNFINFCAGQTITNGQQIANGSCNPIPMGQIASVTNIPSCKYVSPQNLDTLKANTPFTMTLAVENVQLGKFTNADTTYYSAPQQVNDNGQIIGHTHMVIEQIGSLTATKPLDPTKFAFFKGVNDPAGPDGTVSINVTDGLPAGTYRIMTIGTAANHMPYLVAIAQHGSVEDAIYVTVTADGNPDTGNNGNNSASGSSNTTATGTGGQTGGQAAGGNKNATSGGTDSNTAKGKGGKEKTAGKTTGTTNTTGADDKSVNGNDDGKTNGKTQNKRRTFSLDYQKD